MKVGEIDSNRVRLSSGLRKLVREATVVIVSMDEKTALKPVDANCALASWLTALPFKLPANVCRG